MRDADAVGDTVGIGLATPLARAVLVVATGEVVIGLGPTPVR